MQIGTATEPGQLLDGLGDLINLLPGVLGCLVQDAAQISQRHVRTLQLLSQQKLSPEKFLGTLLFWTMSRIQ